jgi:hypothetical protein
VTVRPFPQIAALAAALTLFGCVPQGDFPSLAPRAAERDASSREPVRAAVDVPNDPALRQRLAELLRQAAEGERGFEAAHRPAEAAVRNAGAQGSDRWVEAQQALSRLEAAREGTTRALAELDQLALDRADRPTSSADSAAIEEAIAECGRIAATQQQRLARLRARLSGR